MTRFPARTGARGASGFSLIEMLVTMGIFAVLGVAIVSLLSRATEFSRAGTSATETLDALQTFTETFTDDVRSIYSRADSETGRPAVRLHSDVVKCDADGDGKPDGMVRRLMFVRMIPDETAAPVTRTAGTKVGAKASVDDWQDLEESLKGDLRPTGGLQEVLWTAAPSPGEDPALLTFYRGVRSPIGGPSSYFPTMPASSASARGPQDRGPVDLKEIRAVARPVLSGVLHFGVEFWSRRTVTWSSARKPPEGPLEGWDSTRGVLPKGTGPAEFWFANVAAAQGTPSLDDPTDDTWPRRLRVTLVVEESGRNARTGTLFGDLAPDTGVVDVGDARFIPATDTKERFVKIGAEWIAFTGVDGNRLTGCRRGVRGTAAAAHAHGSRVHYGRTVVREVAVPTFRDAYRDELPSFTQGR